MGRFMIVIPTAIVVGSLIGVAKYNFNLTEDQSLSIAVMASLIILYATRETENEIE